MTHRLPLAPIAAIAAATMALSGCAAQRAELREELARTRDDPECDATAVQNVIGQKVDTAMGERLRKASGAEVLRWAPPNSAMTMDFRPDRLTVAYDQNMAITQITCG
jgi:hypothetical protein